MSEPLVVTQDSFTRLCNSLELDESEELKKNDIELLKFAEDIKVYQFPQNRIYIRKCYAVAYEDIKMNLLSGSDSNYLVTGQPGIGKSAFIYYLIYKMRKEFEEYNNINYHIRFVKARKDRNDISSYYLENDKLIMGGKFIEKYINVITIADTVSILPGKYTILINSPDYQSSFFAEESYYFHPSEYDECMKWFTICISENKDDIRNMQIAFKRYGGIFRHIYYDYLYRKNFNSNYWDYYVYLIDNVIGNIGINLFVNNFLRKDQLKVNVHSNIIMMYEFEDSDIKKEPKDNLRFISEDIKLYACYKLGFIDDIETCNNIISYYNNKTINKEVKKYLLKQIMSFVISKYPRLILKQKYETDQLYYLTDYSFIYFPNHGNERIVVVNEKEECDFIVRNFMIKVLVIDETFEAPKPEENVYIKDKEIKISFIVVKIDNKLKKIEENNFNNEIVTDSIAFTFKREAESKTSEIKQIEDEDSDEDSDELYRIDNTLEAIHDIDGKYIDDEKDKLLNTLKIESNTIRYGKKENVYLKRNCYNKIIDEIEMYINNDSTFQKNFLIIGNRGIGKQILSLYLTCYYVYCKSNYSVYYIDANFEEKRLYKYDDRRCEVAELSSFTISKRNYDKKLMIISYKSIIGEDDYPDADVIINLYDSFDSSIKTYQSKRCPYVMHIPPFDEKEFNDLIEIIENKTNLKQYESNFRNYGGIPSLIFKDDNKHDSLVKTQLKDYYNKGNVIPFNFVCRTINNNQSSSILDLIFKNIPSDNNKIKSIRLDFISQHIKDIVDSIYENKDRKYVNDYITEYQLHPSSGYTGYLYEYIIFDSLIQKDFDLCKMVYTTVKGKNCPYNIFIPKYPKSKAEFDNCINNLKENEIIFTSYNQRFPDVDVFIGDIGIQITISNTHVCSILFVQILKKLHDRMIGVGKKRKLKDGSEKEIVSDGNFYYAIITTRKRVYLKFEERNKDSYPSSLTSDIDILTDKRIIKSLENECKSKYREVHYDVRNVAIKS